MGLSLPCLIPTDWITPPEYESVDGSLVDAEDDDDDERTRMLRKEQWRRCSRLSEDEWTDEMGRFGSPGSASSTPAGRRSHTREEGPRPVTVRDTDGREVPASERAPLPRRIT